MAKQVPGTQFFWDQKTGRYRDARGRFVSWSRVQTGLYETMNNAAGNMRDLAQALRDGRISLQAWRDIMAIEIRNLHAASAAVAKGGWGKMTPADWGRVGSAVRKELWYLNRMAGEIVSGKQRLDGTLLRRAAMYGQAGKKTFANQQGVEADRLGYDEEHSELGAAEHCDECVGEADRGWVSIGSLIPIGFRLCMNNCACKMSYRNSKTGKQW